MINNLVTETGCVSLNHVGEELCGDHFEVVTVDENTKVVVLADGLGSGVKANILAILVSKILSTMISASMPMNECIATIAKTLPICQERNIAYSTFTIAKITNNKKAEIYNFDNPLPILLRRGKSLEIPFTDQIIENKKIQMAEIDLINEDALLFMSDGVIHAGIGQVLNFGWERKEVIDYISKLYDPSYCAKTLATFITEKCNGLYDGRPGDDTSVVAIKIRERLQVNLLIGPAGNIEDDEKMLSLFFGKEGKHIVCGGTTSSIAAKYLGKELEMALDYEDLSVPPTASIEGVDIVSEGVVTINKVLEHVKDFDHENKFYFDWSFKKDGASKIAKMLLEEATDINFFLGCAVNPAHQHESMNIGFSLKLKLIEELEVNLKKIGKKVKVSYF